MAHNIYNDGTKDCMFVVGTRQDAWHQLGQRCDSAPSWDVTEQAAKEHVPFDSPIISPMDDSQFLKALGIRY